MRLRAWPRCGFYHLTTAAAVALLTLAGIARAGMEGHEAGQSIAPPGLAYSTYLGGSDDEGDWLYGAVVSIAVDAAGTGLVYATYLGGNSHESPNGIALDAAGNTHVAGSTDSHDFPTVNAFQPTHPGGTTTSSGFVAKLSADGSALLYSTYLGGSVEDVVQGIAVDAAGHAYVTGATDSSDFPTTAGVLQQGPGDRACGWTFCTHAFVTKVAPAGNVLVYSTYVSGESDDIATRIAIDDAGNAYVVGRTASRYFPIVNASQSDKRGLDAFALKLSADDTRLLWSTYLGGSPGETMSLEGFDGGSRSRWTRPAGPVRRGTAFTVSDTVVNGVAVAMPRSTTTRYYLFADAVRNAGDTLLGGARAIPILGPSAVSSGPVSLVVPSSTPPGTYVALGCADDTLLVGESSEANNCRASATALVVSP